MSKFGRKLILWILLIVVGLGGISLFINTQFIERYYLSIKKYEMNQVYDKIKEISEEELWQVIGEENKEEGIFIITLPWQAENDKLNDALKEALINKGINIKKLWIWEKDFNTLSEGEAVNQIYNQGHLNYSILVKLVRKGRELIVIGSIIPHTTQVISIINIFTLVIWISSLVGMMLIITWYIKRMTTPLMEIKELADDISHFKFRKMEVHTGDELEELAESINRMSHRLEASHRQLENKNQYMKQLLADVSHELKTPIALVKAYALGIQDDIDDGTFLETIIEQNELMSKMVEQLLSLSKLESHQDHREMLNISDLLKSIIKTQQVYIDQQPIQLQIETQEDIWYKGNKEGLTSILTNLITNAIKYTTDQQIEIILTENKGNIHFKISNGIRANMKEHLPYIWEPFYVGEASRNKELCGTGLGLYITAQLLQKYNIEYGCNLEGEKIVFYIKL